MFLSKPDDQLQKLDHLVKLYHIGLYAKNTKGHQIFSYNANEIFPIQSTFKVIVAAKILQISQNEDAFLEKEIKFDPNGEFPFHSPITEKTEGKMTIHALCKAAVTYSDNKATNLLMEELGGLMHKDKLKGPSVITEFARSIVGNDQFDISHFETDLNCKLNMLKDASTAAFMGELLEKLVLGNALLQSTQRALLMDWMKASSTGKDKIEAGVPGRDVAGKTGGGNGISNEIAVIFTPGDDSTPIILSVYTVKKNPNQTDENTETIIKRVTRIVADLFNEWVPLPV